MKYLLLALTLCLASCSTTGTGTGDLFIGYFSDGVEITGLKGDLTGAGYNMKSKTAYLIYANGTRTTLKIVGAGIGANKLALYLDGGAKIIVDLKTGQIESGTVPQ